MIRESCILNDQETIYLPLVKMTNGITIRLFDPYDMENARKVITQCLPYVMQLKQNGFTTIVVPATKPIPIAWALAVEEQLNLVVLKKEFKPYHTKFKEFSCKSITSDKTNTMFITESDYYALKYRKVIFFDDVLSTGATYKGSRNFLKEQCNIEDLHALFILKEGDAFKADESDNITWLGEIPIN